VDRGNASGNGPDWGNRPIFGLSGYMRALRSASAGEIHRAVSLRRLAQQLQQLADVAGDAPRFVVG